MPPIILPEARTNVAVLNMMMYYIISEGYVDAQFVDQRTEGYEAFKRKF